MSNEEIIGILKSIQDQLKRIETLVASLRPVPVSDRPAEIKKDD
jgi:hypothetical protein